MPKQIVITAGATMVRAELNDSPTARAIVAALPIEARANRWGGEIYFTIDVEADLVGVSEPGGDELDGDLRAGEADVECGAQLSRMTAGEREEEGRQQDSQSEPGKETNARRARFAPPPLKRWDTRFVGWWSQISRSPRSLGMTRAVSFYAQADWA